MSERAIPSGFMASAAAMAAIARTVRWSAPPTGQPGPANDNAAPSFANRFLGVNQAKPLTFGNTGAQAGRPADSAQGDCHD